MLSEEEKKFLSGQKVQLDLVFDGSGMTKSEYQAAMEGTKTIVVSGAAPCKKAGHTLRTKSGHCFQCNPKVISFQKRSKSKGHVYIAGSIKGRYIKVGTSIDLDDRLYKLNEYAYGGTRDWKMLASAFVKEAGKVESSVQRSLTAYQVPGSYVREGKVQKCKELFRCNFEDACRFLHKEANGLLDLRCSSPTQAKQNYSFNK